MKWKFNSHIVHHVNRLVIAALSIAATLLDGVSLQDLLLAIAIVMWLWMPESMRLERKLFRSLKEVFDREGAKNPDKRV